MAILFSLANGIFGAGILMTKSVISHFEIFDILFVRIGAGVAIGLFIGNIVADLIK